MRIWGTLMLVAACTTADDASVGRVKMMYARARTSDDAVAYGWLAVAWRYDGDAWHYFVD